eukprot:1379528-Amorphochlora_amoeboformis.AAC.2
MDGPSTCHMGPGRYAGILLVNRRAIRGTYRHHKSGCQEPEALVQLHILTLVCNNHSTTTAIQLGV